MMPEHLTPQAGAVSRRAYDHARRLGHRYLGGEHFLLALSAGDDPAGGVQIGVEHLALGLIAADDGLVPAILAALGAYPPAWRAAILDRYRQAS
jgi:Clp amino terminal domain, pathogenicity island component